MICGYRFFRLCIRFLFLFYLIRKPSSRGAKSILVLVAYAYAISCDDRSYDKLEKIASRELIIVYRRTIVIHV